MDIHQRATRPPHNLRAVMWTPDSTTQGRSADEQTTQALQVPDASPSPGDRVGDRTVHRVGDHHRPRVRRTVHVRDPHRHDGNARTHSVRCRSRTHPARWPNR